jgi:hypothetical protein
MIMVGRSTVPPLLLPEFHQQDGLIKCPNLLYFAVDDFYAIFCIILHFQVGGSWS